MNKTVPAVSDFPNCLYCDGKGSDLDTTYDRTGIEVECARCHGTGKHLPKAFVKNAVSAALAAQGQEPVARATIYMHDGRRQFRVQELGTKAAGDLPVGKYDLYVAPLALTVPAQPVGVPADQDAVTRLMDAVEGECDGLAITEEQAKAILAYVAAAPQPPAEGGWMPIERAPKDGTEILVYGRKEGGGYYRDVQSWPGDWVGSWPVEYMGYAAGGPLGWMPLPPAPANGGEQNG